MRAFSTPPRYRRNKNCSLRSQNTTFVPIKSMILFIASVTVFLIPSKVVANNSSIDSSFMDIVLSSISGVSLSTMLTANQTHNNRQKFIVAPLSLGGGVCTSTKIWPCARPS
uniref:Uncharacterized protein n=1 Tax=Opuntia streptacantha TaxID=393608 RepID=A0A7C9A3Z5_OPUST